MSEQKEEEKRPFDSCITIRIDEDGKPRVHIGDNDVWSVVGILRNVIESIETFTPLSFIEGSFGVVVDTDTLINETEEDPEV